MRPCQVLSSIQAPEGSTNHIGAPSAPYVNQTPKIVRCCCSSARPQPFCDGPPHHMSPTRRGAAVASTGPKPCRVIDLRPATPPMEYSSVASLTPANAIVAV